MRDQHSVIINETYRVSFQGPEVRTGPEVQAVQVPPLQAGLQHQPMARISMSIKWLHYQRATSTRPKPAAPQCAGKTGRGGSLSARPGDWAFHSGIRKPHFAKASNPSRPSSLLIELSAATRSSAASRSSRGAHGPRPDSLHGQLGGSAVISSYES